MLLSKRAIDAYVGREFSSFDWMKRLSREQLLAELGRFKVPPEFKSDPWLHQLVCQFIGMCEPRFLFLLDMGLGKSKILADLITQRRREGRLRGRHALITVPRLVNIDSWLDDLPRHSDLEPNGIMVENIEEKRYRLLHPTGDVTVIDYMGLQWALSKMGKVQRGRKWVRGLVPDMEMVAKAQKLYTFLGIDESHKLRNPDSLWFALVDHLSSTATNVYATTGTLFGKDPAEAWPQFKLVDRGETFGEETGLFRGAFFKTKVSPWKGTVFEYDKSKTRLFGKMMRNRSLRYDEDEVNDLPDKVYRRIDITLSPEQDEHYRRALEGAINHDGGDDRALGAPWLRMRQITSGYLRWDDEHGQHKIHFKQNPKLDMMARLVDEAGDSKVVVCYDYTDTGAMICERLKAEGVDHVWFYGGTKDKPGARRRFLDDPACRVMVMNSEAGGTGNDGLQKVARYMIFYESPTPPITRKQTEKRIHRPGMTDRAFFYDLVCRKTVDAGILTSLAEGRDLYDDVMRGQRKGLLRGA